MTLGGSFVVWGSVWVVSGSDIIVRCESAGVLSVDHGAARIRECSAVFASAGAG